MIPPKAGKPVCLYGPLTRAEVTDALLSLATVATEQEIARMLDGGGDIAALGILGLELRLQQKLREAAALRERLYLRGALL